MKERPILFSAPMVRALLNGSKTVTRRIMKIQQPSDRHVMSVCVSSTDKRCEGRNRWLIPDGSHGSAYFVCPFGQPGDRLWVRETWRTYQSLDDCPPGKIGQGAGVQYEAGGSNVPGHSDGTLLGMGKRRPSIFMPRWASRITLEVTGVKVERLHDISEEDARAEGVGIFIPSDEGTPKAAWSLFHADRVWAASFCQLWHEINGGASWDANPWVWAISFRRLAA